MTISELILKLQTEQDVLGDVPVFFYHYGTDLKEVDSVNPIEHWKDEKQSLIDAIELC